MPHMDGQCPLCDMLRGFSQCWFLLILPTVYSQGPSRQSLSPKSCPWELFQVLVSQQWSHLPCANSHQELNLWPWPNQFWLQIHINIGPNLWNHLQPSRASLSSLQRKQIWNPSIYARPQFWATPSSLTDRQRLWSKTLWNQHFWKMFHPWFCVCLCCFFRTLWTPARRSSPLWFQQLWCW